MCRRLLFLIFFILFLGIVGTSGCGTSICLVAPFITGQPGNQTVNVGKPALFTVASAGTAPLLYQWFKNDVPIQGATGAAYVTLPVSAGDSGSKFSVRITNQFGAASSESATLTVGSSNSGNIFFVAPTGDDSYPGTINQPFQTIQHCATTVPTGSSCEIRAGTYRETVTPNSGLTIEAYNMEPVTIDGSDPLKHWTQYKGAIYSTKAKLRLDDTNQLFVDNAMMTEARWPNGDDLFKVKWAKARSGTSAAELVDGDLPHGDWVGAKVHFWSGKNPFGHQTGTVTAGSNGRLSIDVGQSGTCPAICPMSKGYYYLFGSITALDVEREWYYDANTETLYFIAPGKVDPNTLSVRSKQRDYGFDLRGRFNVTIRDLNLFATTIVMDAGSSNNVIDHVGAQYISHFTLLPPSPNDPDGKNFSILQVHVGDSGILVSGSHNIVRNSTISFSAGTGIAVEGSNNEITNNLIENVDYIGDYASGIVLDGPGNLIRNNTVRTAGRQALLIDSVQDQEISYNNLFDAMILSRDGGEIYACCNQMGSGTEVHNNWIHDTKSIFPGQNDSGPLTGIYIDNASQGFVVDQNVLWKNQVYNILVNGADLNTPLNNYIHHNTIPDTASHANIRVVYSPNCSMIQVADNKVVAHISTKSIGSECSFTNNNAQAPGATEMNLQSQVGCNFDGCASDPPPAILEGGTTTSCPFVGAGPE